jgi:hypothetical protein
VLGGTDKRPQLIERAERSMCEDLRNRHVGVKLVISLPAGLRRACLGSALLLVLLTIVSGCGRPAHPPPANAPLTTSLTSAPTSVPRPTTTSDPIGTGVAHQPLWPFPDATAAAAWQESYRTGGHQPWHLDAEMTALSFTQGYLGFTGIDRVTGSATTRNDAWVGVGFTLPDGRDSTAAVIHLVRFGAGVDAPWEVVGTRDDTLVLDTPPYGSQVTSPITAGGTITGVDESLRLQVRQGGTQQQPLGETCCVPAGGQTQRWTATVAFAGAVDGALTLVVSTGGHVADVERFAITGLRILRPA